MTPDEMAAIRLLEREFFASLIDKETKMSTRLQIAICHVLGLIPSAITDVIVKRSEEMREQV